MNLCTAPEGSMLQAQLELASISQDHLFSDDLSFSGSKRKASWPSDHIDALEPQNSSEDGAELQESDDEARKLRRQLRNRLSAQQARDRKKAMMQQLQNQVTHQQQQIQQLQRQLAETEAANSALRNIICALKGQPPCKSSKTAQPQQQQQQQQQQPQQELVTAHSAPLRPQDINNAPKLIAAVSAPLGSIPRSSSNITIQPQQQHAMNPRLPPPSNGCHTSAAATKANASEPNRRPSGTAAAAAASTTAAAMAHTMHPFRRKSSTVAALAGLLPIAQRMASDNPADTRLETLQQLQQQQWQTSADQQVLAAAASAASAAEAAAAAAGGLVGRGSSMRIHDWESESDDPQLQRRQLLLLLAQRDRVRKIGDKSYKQQLMQQQQQYGLHLHQGYAEYKLPDHLSDAGLGGAAHGMAVTSAAAAASDMLPVVAQQQQRQLVSELSNADVASAAAAAAMASAPTSAPSIQQQQQLQNHPSPAMGLAAATAMQPNATAMQPSTTEAPVNAPATSIAAAAGGFTALLESSLSDQQQQKMPPTCTGTIPTSSATAIPTGDINHMSNHNPSNAAAAAATSPCITTSSLQLFRSGTLALELSSQDDLLRLSSSDMMLTDILSDMV